MVLFICALCCILSWTGEATAGILPAKCMIHVGQLRKQREWEANDSLGQGCAYLVHLQRFHFREGTSFEAWSVQPNLVSNEIALLLGTWADLRTNQIKNEGISQSNRTILKAWRTFECRFFTIGNENGSGPHPAGKKLFLQIAVKINACHDM